MATIVALCPYCQRGGVRAPERIIGSVATCPNCGSQFTVVPKEDAPAAASETRPFPAASAVTEESPVLPTRSSSAAPDSDRRDPAFTLSLIAFIAFGLG